MHVLDCTSEHVLEEYDAIRNELFLFDEEVGDKPELVALNKVNAKPAKLNPKPLTLNP